MTELCCPERVALLAYDMQAGILEQISGREGFTETLRFLGDAVLTDVAAFRAALVASR